MTTINDDTHTLFAVALAVVGITAGYAMNRLHGRWAPVAYSFLEASLLVQVINGFLVDYGIAWNVSSPVNGLVVLLLVSIVLYGLTISILGMIPPVLLAIVLLASLLGQAFIVKWVQDNMGISIDYYTILLVLCVLLVLMWYIASYSRDNTVLAFALNSVILMFCSAVAVRILTTPATWNSWNEPTYSITIFDWWLAVDAAFVVASYTLLCHYLRVPSKPTHDHKDIEKATSFSRKLKEPPQTMHRLKEPSSPFHSSTNANESTQPLLK